MVKFRASNFRIGRSMMIFSGLILLPMLAVSQEKSPRSYISFGMGASAFPGKFGDDGPLYQGSTSMGVGYELNGAYYLENIGFGVKTGTYLQPVKKPSRVEVNNTEFQGNEYSGAWTSNVYLIGPHYAFRKGKFQWDFRLYLGSLKAEGPELKWGNGNGDHLKVNYGSWNRFAINPGVSASYDLTNIISASLSADYIHSRPTKVVARMEHPYNDDNLNVETHKRYEQSIRMLNVMASLRFNLYHNECE